ncbi:Peptidase T [Novipirellula galeiformis]|uniref:Peptidase T n=1 Tax=Novipirellula galeiformis TaxID=2528004 RepID=A0A5C6BYX8_9BACT|nr:peptidase T [Novipirellula galeiformis]TWU17493.1 Peptidase T [Novipirellula galeiformis]
MTHPPTVTINSTRLLERFLRYVRIDTAADPNSDQYPSSQKQRTLARFLEQELREMSITDARMDENALVWGTIPATNGGHSPVVALVAHMDTSPEAPSENVSPQVIESYPGGDIRLPAGIEISCAATPELESMIGKTLVTTDGTTLLGGDDKAGIAIIMELAQTLIENPHLQHGDVRVLFTCDEEIGHGTDKIDLPALNAMVAYTIDGGGAGDIDVETFSADGATVRFTGNNIHPAIAKGVMVNAMRAAADFVADLPRQEMTPETTSDRQGFIHPHAIHGGVGEATVELILRSFDSDDLVGYADRVRSAAETAAKRTPGVKADVTIYRQYRNLREGLETLPQAVEFAEQAFKNLGRPCRREIVRGGTDGSQLTEKGLPTPNLSSGQHNIHSVREFACLDEMVEATEHLVELLSLWSNQRS